MAYLTDKTSQTDLLERSQYIDKLVEMIETASTPYNIAIFGEWGTGKSNILDFIKNALIKKEISLVEFSAWKYVQDTDSLRRKLLIETRSQLGEKDPYKNLYEATTFKGLEFSRLIKLLPEFLFVAFLWFIAISLAMWLIFWLGKSFKLITQNNFFAIYKDLLLIPALGTMIPLVSAILTHIEVKPPKIESTELFEKSFKESIEKSFLPFWFSHLPNFVKSKFKEKKGNILEHKRLVILIDDLDRCPRYKVIEVLDALMTFFIVRNCVYVVTSDHKIIEQAIVDQNKASAGKEKDYLDKIFQFTFPIPPLTPEIIEKFAREQIKELSIDTLNEDSTVEILIRGLEWNPRKIKLVLNSLRFLVLSSSANTLIQNNKDLLLKTVIIQKEFDQFFNLLTGDWQKLSEVERWLQTEDQGTLPQLDQYTQNLIQQAQSNTRLKDFLKLQPLWGSKEVEPFFTLTSKAGYRNVSIPDKAQFSRYALEANFGALRTILEKGTRPEITGYLRSLVALYQTPLQEPQKSNVARSFIYCIDLESNSSDKIKLISEFITYVTYPGIQTLANILNNELVTLIRQSDSDSAISLSKILAGIRRFADFNIINNLLTAFLQAPDEITDEIYNILVKETLRYLNVQDDNFRNIPYALLPQFLNIPKKTALAKKLVPKEIYQAFIKNSREKHRSMELLWQIKDLWIDDKRFSSKFKKDLESLKASEDPNIQSMANSILTQWT